MQRELEITLKLLKSDKNNLNQIWESILSSDVNAIDNNILNELVIFFDDLKNKHQKYEFFYK